jgi:hypothetical protein
LVQRIGRQSHGRERPWKLPLISIPRFADICRGRTSRGDIMAEQRNQMDDEPEQVEIAGVSGPIDLETVRKIKDLVRRYGKETLQEIVDQTAKAA